MKQKNNNKNTTCAKQKFNKILLQKTNKTKLCKKKRCSINKKVMENYIYIYWAHSSRKFLKKFSTYMWPIFTQLWPMCTQDSIKSELRVN
jgi:hypothetical protein